MKTPQQWLIAGIGIGVFGLIVALLGLVLPGIVLVVVGVILLAILGVGYPSPQAVREGRRTLYEDGDADPYGEPDQPEDPNDRFVSVGLARDGGDERTDGREPRQQSDP